MHAALASSALALSSGSRGTAGVLLLTIVFIESGGWYLLRVVTGHVPLTDFQKSFARAGHAHAGVLVILALVGLVYADAANLSGALGFFARNGIWVAAILMPAGFFLSSAGRDVTRPNRLVILIYAGALSLAVGVVCLGIGLLTS